ncbi:spore germination protein [Anaerovirgula multivorans]|uniref:Spore germination protein n=1 Tax=Anaerovirgula multivorans TaxID=312168 RepID=A0A239HDW4_9FIRM|nr:endospore germination permease [Anaerovirgula multivorans]SNS79325.1 spore germination protein [Anaerovirgula multivorans]
MFLNNDKISISQMIHIVILNMVGVGILNLPRGLVEEGRTDGWMILVLGGLIVIGFSTLHGYIIKSFPGRSYFEIVSLTLTKPVAYFAATYFFAYFMGITALVTRVFVEVLKTYTLPHTPKGVIILGILLAAVYLNRKGIEVLGRMAELIGVPLGVVIFALFAASWTEIKFDNLLPIFQTPFMDILRGLPFVFFSFLGFEVILVFGMFLSQPKKLAKAGAVAVSIVLMLYILINISVLGSLGEQQVQQLIWPLLSTFETIELPGAFIENVGVIVMSVWIFAIFMTIAPMYLAGNHMITQLLHGKEHSYLGLPLLPIILFIALWPDSVTDTYEYMGTFTDYTGYGIVIILPLIILASIVIKERNKKGTSGI